jgi:hypothetical protein
MREKAAGAAWPMPASIQDTFARFLEVAKKDNITRLNESQQGFGVLEKAVEQAAR